MIFKSFHWLKIVEYIAIIAIFISLVMMAIASIKVIYILLPMFLALVLNLVNRLRLEKRIKRQIKWSTQKLNKQFSAEIQILHQRIQEARLKLPEVKDIGDIDSLQEYLANLEESLSNVVQYLNNYSLPKRIEHLEEENLKLAEQLANIANYLLNSNPKLDSEASSFSPPQNRLAATSRLSLQTTTQTWKCINTLSEHSDFVTALTVSHDGKFIASASWDQTIKIWSLATGELINSTIGHSQGLLAIIFTGYSEGIYSLATSSFDQTIKLWQLQPEDETDKLVINNSYTLKGHTGSIRAIAVTSDSQTLISGSYDQTIKQWNLEHGTMSHSCNDQSGTINAIAISPDGQIIASGGGDGTITLWKLRSEEKLGFLTGNVASIESLAISHNGQTIAAGCIDGTIKIWQLNPNILPLQTESLPSLTISAHSGQVMSLAFSPIGEVLSPEDEIGQTLFSGSADGTVKIWQLSNGQQLAILKVVDETNNRLCRVFALTLSPDGELLVTGDAEGRIKLWLRE